VTAHLPKLVPQRRHKRLGRRRALARAAHLGSRGRLGGRREGLGRRQLRGRILRALSGPRRRLARLSCLACGLACITEG